MIIYIINFNCIKKGVKTMKKISLTPSYAELLAQSELTAHAYKCLMLLLIEPKTSAQIADTLHIQRQNASRYIAELSSKGLVTIDRVEGRNKFIRAVTSIKEINELNIKIDGQTSLI